MIFRTIWLRVTSFKIEPFEPRRPLSVGIDDFDAPKDLYGYSELLSCTIYGNVRLFEECTAVLFTLCPPALTWLPRFPYAD